MNAWTIWCAFARRSCVIGGKSLCRLVPRIDTNCPQKLPLCIQETLGGYSCCCAHQHLSALPGTSFIDTEWETSCQWEHADEVKLWLLDGWSSIFYPRTQTLNLCQCPEAPTDYSGPPWAWWGAEAVPFHLNICVSLWARFCWPGLFCGCAHDSRSRREWARKKWARKKCHEGRRWTFFLENSFWLSFVYSSLFLHTSKWQACKST